MAKSLSVVEFVLWEHMATTLSSYLVASSLYGVFPGPLGQFTLVTYPGERNIHLRLDYVTRNTLAARNNEV